MNKQRIFTFVMLFILFANLFTIGCSTKKLEVPSDSDLSPELLEGRKLVEERCTVCHNTDRIYSEYEDSSGWGKYIDDMIKRGAKLNTEEREKVLNYLSSLKPIE